MSSTRRYRTLGIGAALLALPACSTQELSPRPLTIAGTEPSAESGHLTIVFPPPDATYEQWQARISGAPSFTAYHVFMDGNQLAFGSVDDAQPLVIGEGSMADAGHLPAGTHQFEVAVAGGGPTVFAGEGAFSPGSTTQLFIFGAHAPLQGRVVSYPAIPAPGMLHASVTSLVRSGQTVEVVSCLDGAACEPLSPPLALGQTFDADFPGGGSLETGYRLASGATLGWRQVATDPGRTSPVQQLCARCAFENYDPGMPLTSPANLTAAPVYVSADGQVLSSF
jgi:hypothetical protein